MSDIHTDSFIFLDARGKRWPRLRLVMFLVSVFVFIVSVMFVQTLFVPSQLKLPPAVQQLKARLKVLQNKEHQIRHKATSPLWLRFVKGSSGMGGFLSMGPQNGGFLSPKREKMPVSGPVREIHLGFYESGDPNGVDSLKAHAGELTHLCPDWITVVDGLGRLKVLKEQKILDLARENGVVLMPLLSNMVGDAWAPEAVEGLINGPASRQDQFITRLKMQLKDMGAGGVVIDWEQVDPSYRDAMTAFLTKIASALHAEDMELWLCVPMGSDLAIFDLDALAQELDRFIAMLHDENSETDPPGPVASWDWFNGWLDTLVDEYGEPSQWVISLGSYGYDWADGEKEAETISFADIMSRAGRSGLDSCDFDAPSYNPHFAYEDSGVAHTVWFLDAVTFLNQMRVARSHDAGGIAISRLGTEDPGVWDALRLDTAKPLTHKDLAPLEVMRPGDTIANVGRGNFITMDDERSNGMRRINIDKNAGNDGLAIERYEKFPSYLTIAHQGMGQKGFVTITFDDGPDPEWTPQILDILKAKGVKAAFFMIGSNMEKHPDIVRRVLKEGHTIGVHTYTHPNIARVSEERAYLEFNATQRLIEAITGHSTILFRPPYNADTNPHDADELVPIKLAQELGYLTVTEDIDTEDWSRPGVDKMLESVRDGRLMGGDVVLLHDAGGDRSQTVEALPRIIDYLKARGDRIVPLSVMLGVSPDQLMPAIPGDQQPMTRMVSGGGFKVLHTVENFFWAFMIVATVLVVLRTFIVAVLAIKNRNGDEKMSDGVSSHGLKPEVSVLIAAYNEEKVIAGTLTALLNTTYSGWLDVIVVDDGSTDKTADIVAGMAERDSRIRLIRQLNLGKAAALRAGLDAALNEIVVTLDADTQFEPETIQELVRPFADPKTGAVSGRARVGNPNTLVARFQSLEYTCGFNLDRRAYHLLNCITVVPGAVSAFKKSAVMQAGGISTDTLAEDTDITLSLHKSGFKICYAPRAVAWTEAPLTIKAFARQRFRWAFGTLQCLWKHRDMLFDPRYRALAWFSLPSAWFFNILLVAVGPLIDALLIFSLIVGPANHILYMYFFVFLSVDLLLAAVACLIEREPLRQIWLVLPMRFIYRPVLSFAILKAILRAIKGVWVSWGKLDRTASVPCKV
jgi:cellulose synthase/poly-beta-1,6-N-acetylglucosamine synthase-like glycosyltransferase/peptidoglycan/xylan/chitin deacetylase (PgdA/CDA1 family)/spore germination protein YaaH